MTKANDAWKEVLRPFNSLGDGVILSIVVHFDRGNGMHIVVRMNARREDGAWCCLTIVCGGLDSFRLENPSRVCMSVISSQVSWVEEGDLIGIDFGGLGDPSESLTDLKQSPMHVVCSRVSVGLSPEVP